MEIAIYGGSFNPPTKSHEAVVRACLKTEPVEEVWLMPSGMRTDKSFGTSDINRLLMLQKMRNEAFQFDPRVRICSLELELPPPTQTWRTVHALQVMYPSDNFHFVFGADSYLDMPNWQHGERLQRELGMLIMRRDHYAVEPTENITILPALADAENISSTFVRERAMQGLNIGDFVCESVARYISRLHLYTNNQLSLSPATLALSSPA